MRPCGKGVNILVNLYVCTKLHINNEFLTYFRLKILQVKIFQCNECVIGNNKYSSEMHINISLLLCFQVSVWNIKIKENPEKLSIQPATGMNKYS